MLKAFISLEKKYFGKVVCHLSFTNIKKHGSTAQTDWFIVWRYDLAQQHRLSHNIQMEYSQYPFDFYKTWSSADTNNTLSG